MCNNTAINNEEDFVMDMICNPDKLCEIIYSIAKDLLAFDTKKSEDEWNDLLYESAEEIKKGGIMKEAMIAMLAEEICAKRAQNITDFFQKIADANGCTSCLPFYEKSIYRIACKVLGGTVQAIELFKDLIPVSEQVIEQCGVYEGGF